MNCTLTILSSENGNNIQLACSAGERLYDVLARNGIRFSAPCGGKGKCGKCRVHAWGGIKTDNDGTCLICKTYIENDCTIDFNEKHARVLTGGIVNTFETDGHKGLGLAADIGTTTIAVYLMDMLTGKEFARTSMLNPQRIHGADVISRLQYALISEDNRRTLSNEIHTALDEAGRILLEKAGLSNQSILLSAFAGNTVMMHLASGYDASGLAKAPFIPYYTAAHRRTVYGKKVFLGGCVSGYVGADTTAAMLACGFDTGDETVLLIDIGTNGEIVLRDKGRYFCCSCAAGPAFEGAHITCGTGAVDGAIDHLTERVSGFTYTTINGAEPSGICGSGLIDAIAYLARNESINPMGRMGERFYISDNVFIAPEDVREVQLAKAAIAAGIEILCSKAQISYGEIDKVYLAGGFGNCISVASACSIGLLPKEIEHKTTGVGNAAGDGIKMQLLSEASVRRAEKLRRLTEYVELSAEPDFEDIYSDNLLFY